MTRITISRGSGYDVCVEEHTRSEVCAGISALVYALGGWIANHDKSGIVELDDGEARMHTAITKDSDVAVEMFTLGLLQIQMGYPEDLMVFVKQGA